MTERRRLAIWLLLFVGAPVVGHAVGWAAHLMGRWPMYDALAILVLAVIVARACWPFVAWMRGR